MRWFAVISYLSYFAFRSPTRSIPNRSTTLPSHEGCLYLVHVVKYSGDDDPTTLPSSTEISGAPQAENLTLTVT
jgi:hypothetical protein